MVDGKTLSFRKYPINAIFSKIDVLKKKKPSPKWTISHYSSLNEKFESYLSQINFNFSLGRNIAIELGSVLDLTLP